MVFLFFTVIFPFLLHFNILFRFCFSALLVFRTYYLTILFSIHKSYTNEKVFKKGQSLKISLQETNAGTWWLPTTVLMFSPSHHWRMCLLWTPPWQQSVVYWLLESSTKQIGKNSKAENVDDYASSGIQLTFQSNSYDD